MLYCTFNVAVGSNIKLRIFELYLTVTFHLNLDGTKIYLPLEMQILGEDNLCIDVMYPEYT